MMDSSQNWLGAYTKTVPLTRMKHLLTAQHPEAEELSREKKQQIQIKKPAQINRQKMTFKMEL